EARGEVLELGELDLQLSLMGLRALGEYVQDEAHAVDDAAVQAALEVALLHGGELVVEDRDARARRGDVAGHLLHLALAGEERGVGPVAASLHEGARFHARAGGEPLYLIEAVGIARLTEIE